MLYDPRSEKLEIMFTKLLLTKCGPSGSAAVALALVQAATGCLTIDNFLVVGEVDFRGRLLQVAGLAPKARVAMDSSVSTMVIPKDGAEEAIAEGRDNSEGEVPPLPLLLLESHRAIDMLDVLEVVVPGEDEVGTCRGD